MLTVEFQRLGIRPGDRVLDIGCGAGRHSFEVLKRGGVAVSVDLNPAVLEDVFATAGAMKEMGEIPAPGHSVVISADALHLPFPDESFDVVIASEVLEHIPDDVEAMREFERILRPGGRLAVTVPRFFPERICWALSDDYHEYAGGHVRIYRQGELKDKLRESGLRPWASHHAHALHSPYWWLRCAIGVDNDDAPPTKLYYRFLVWDITKKPVWTRVVEKTLDPVLGKSLVVYAGKPNGALGNLESKQQERGSVVGAG
ncbi:MAG: class I SAM-dependent methyltransferase [Acidimicrobiia bacterium]